MALGLPADLVHLTGDRLLVRIDEVGNFHIFLAHPAADVAAAAAVQASHRDTEPIIRAENLGLSLGTANQRRGTGGQ